MHRSELSAGSSSKHPIIIKFLIDVDEYNHLMSLEKFKKEFYEKRHKELLPTLDHTPGKVFEQSGSGKTENKSPKKSKVTKSIEAAETRLRDSLKEEFNSFMRQLYSNLSKNNFVNQHGSGGDQLNGALPRVPDLLSFDQEAEKNYLNFEEARSSNQVAGPPIETFTEFKNIEPQTDKSLINDILSLVPSAEKHKAEKIINYCLANPDQISWDKNFVVTVYNVTYPRSNIKTFMRRLYIRKKSKDLKDYPGLVPFITVLLSAGLGHLFYKKNFTFLSRKHNFKQHQSITTSLKFENSPWYFLSEKSNTINAN